jgi:hypothetical protein
MITMDANPIHELAGGDITAWLDDQEILEASGLPPAPALESDRVPEASVH